MKFCKGCESERPLDDFSLASRGKYGRAYYCRTCAAQKRREYHAAHPELRVSEARRQRVYMAANPEQHQKEKARSRTWRVANMDRMNELVRAWCAANPERSAEHHRRYRAANPHVAINGVERRRARLAAVQSDLTSTEWREVVADFGECCAYCLRGDVKLEMDHIQPIASGGGHTRSNVVPACRSCNASKHSKELVQFLEHSTRKAIA